MTIAVRELGLADTMMVEELLDTCRPGWQDALAPGASGPTAFTADPRTFIFGAYDDQVPVGWVWGTHIRRPDGRLMSYVHQLDVVESHRRSGVATTLMEAAIDLARRDGSGRLWLMTQEENAGARSLYESLGAADDGGASILYRWPL
ncbi:MAG: GNAT family N-acetyltransferase [Actinomycetota bacterium]